jgi:hypothetical protein
MKEILFRNKNIILDTDYKLRIASIIYTTVGVQNLKRNYILG